jgi:phosphatidate cytidylyltransferase
MPDAPITPAPVPAKKAHETAIRFVAATVMLALFFLGMYADVAWIKLPACFSVIMLVVCLAALREFYGMMKAAAYKPFVAVGMLATVVFVGSSWASSLMNSALLSEKGMWEPRGMTGYVLALLSSHVVIFFVILLILLAACARRKDWTNAVGDMAVTVLGVIYTWFLPGYFLFQIDTGLSLWFYLRNDALMACASLVIFTILVAKSSDIFAYFGGRAFGRHKMTPRLSPKKTWEGFACGIAGSVAVALTLYHLKLSFLPLPEFVFSGATPVVIFGIVVGIASVFGDLSASLIKRSCSVKDSGAIVPGYGGIIDVIDYLVVAAPVAFLYINIMIVWNMSQIKA